MTDEPTFLVGKFSERPTRQHSNAEVQIPTPSISIILRWGYEVETSRSDMRSMVTGFN